MGVARPPVSPGTGLYVDLLAFAAADLVAPIQRRLPPYAAILRIAFPPFLTELYVGSRN